MRAILKICTRLKNVVTENQILSMQILKIHVYGDVIVY